jgi:hypothetical protein
MSRSSRLFRFVMRRSSHPLELTQPVAVLPKQFLRPRLGICAVSKSGCPSSPTRNGEFASDEILTNVVLPVGERPDHLNFELGVVSLPARIRRVLLPQPIVAVIRCARAV